MAYVKEKYGFATRSEYIAQVKDKLGLEKKRNCNLGSKKTKSPICTAKHEAAIMDAFRHFNMI